MTKNATIQQELLAQNTSYGTASLWLGIVSVCLFLMPYFGLPIGILAIVFSGTQQRRYGKTSNGTAGLVLGIVGVLVNVLALLCFLFMLLFLQSFKGVR